MDKKIPKLKLAPDPHKPEEEYKKTWSKYWKKEVTNPDGTLNEDKIKRELHDYYVCMVNVQQVYLFVSGNKINNPLTLAKNMKAFIAKQFNNFYETGFKEGQQDAKK